MCCTATEDGYRFEISDFGKREIVLCSENKADPPLCFMHMSLLMRKPVFRVSDQVPHNQALQPHKMARGLKFRIKKVEGLYYLCSENKGANQLRSSASLFSHIYICKKLVFS